MNTEVKGIFPPMVTSFTEDGEIYEKGIRNVVNFLIGKQVDGLFVTGSYGSFALMTDEERKRVVKIIFDEVADRVPIIVHAGTAGTKRTIELAKHAQDLGAAAIASVTPYYYSGFAYKEEEILSHYETVARAVDVPLYLYNNPKTTYFNTSPFLLKRLADVGVKGIKDSSGDFMQFADFINTVRPSHPDFNFMVGTVGLIYPAFLLKTKACVAGTANVFPELVRELVQVIQEGDHERASDLQLKVIEIRKAQAITGFRPAGCYSILQMRGIDAGTARAPWRLPNATEYDELYRTLVGLQLLGSSAVA